MNHRYVAASLSVIVVITLSVIPAAAQSVPRTPWGQPDIQGIWDFRTITPLERPTALADKEFLTTEEAANLEQETVDRNERLLQRDARRTEATASVDLGEDGAPGFYNNFWLDGGTTSTGRTSLVIDPPNGRIPPLTAEAQQAVEARRAYLRDHPADSWLDRNTSDRCIVGFNAGPPITPLGYNQNVQVFQTPDRVVLVTEMVHTPRVVPLDGRPALNSDIRQWSGDSRGHWEGDTLVVETANFKDERRWIPLGTAPAGTGSSANMTLVERFTRVDVDTLEYTFTVTDPEIWTSPWTASQPMRRTDIPMFEYACHEGNYSMEGILAGARAEEKAAAQPGSQGTQ
ncbi:uncharacterized protein METZ01_LOCUS141339 [marine metagenome]|uniref:Uncharacterized protein n=1 Tax=marine metagenome TaxID=408172 RepID=A0A381ZGT3_9ZZZZ